MTVAAALLVSALALVPSTESSVLLFAVSSNAGAPSDEREVSRRIADELNAVEISATRPISWTPGCEDNPACVVKALDDGRAPVGLWCEVVRAGPVVQVSLRVYTRDAPQGITDERVMKLDELNDGAAVIAPVVLDQITEAARAPSPVVDPVQTTAIPPSTTTTPTTTAPDNASSGVAAEPTAEMGISPILIAGAAVVGVGLATLIAGGAVFAAGFQVRNDPQSLGTEKELATFALVGGGVLLPVGMAIAALGLAVGGYALVVDEVD